MGVYHYFLTQTVIIASTMFYQLTQQTLARNIVVFADLTIF